MKSTYLGRILLSLKFSLITPILFYTAKKVSKKALGAASRSVATDSLLYVKPMTKNCRLTTFKQMQFS